jgi:radical SAM-linked protein
MISHRDLLRTMERLFRRAALPLSMSEGFHPKPRLCFPSALALGTLGRDEVMELDVALDEPPAADAMLDRLRREAPPGLHFKSVEVRPPAAPKAQLESLDYEVRIPEPRRCAVAAAIDRLSADRTYRVTRAGRNETIALWESLRDIALSGDMLRFRIGTQRTATTRPRDVLEALGLSDLEDDGCVLTRTEVRLTDEIGSHAMPTRKDTEYEAGNVDQRRTAGGMPHRDR